MTNKQPDVTLEESPEELEEMMTETMVEVHGEDHPVGALVEDIKEAHKELDAYKNGALVMAEALDERIMQAKNDDEETLVKILEELKESGFGVYLRLQRGDLELLGERDGKHSGYFAPEQDDE